MTMLVAKLRGAAFLICLVVITLVIGILGSPTFWFQQKHVLALAKFWGRCVLGALRITCGIRHDIEGIDNIPDGPALVAANHQSMWETIALTVLLPNPKMVFKKELTKIPIYGAWSKFLGIPVDRNAGSKAIRQLTKDAVQALEKGHQVILFPEGTRLKPGTTAPYNPGIAAIYKTARVPCVPVAHNSGQYWLHPGITKSPGTIKAIFLPPIPADIDRKEFLRQLKMTIDHHQIGLSKPAMEPTA